MNERRKEGRKEGREEGDKEDKEERRARINDGKTERERHRQKN